MKTEIYTDRQTGERAKRDIMRKGEQEKEKKKKKSWDEVYCKRRKATFIAPPSKSR